MNNILKPNQLFCWFFFLTTLCFSQEKEFRHFGLNEGLPQETIHCMVKDSLGFIWLGTSDGVVRFDGHDFIIPNDKSDNLEGLLINDLKQDFHQNIWIATSQNGVYSYNYVTNEQKQIGITNSNATSIVCDKKGNIFVSYFNKGVYKFYRKNGIYKSEKIQFNNFKNTEITILTQIKDILIFGTNSGELLFFKDQNKKVVSVEKIENTNLLGKINNLVLIKDNIWVCATKGLFLLKNNLKSIVPIPLDKVTLNQKNDFSVFDIVEKNNTLFIATNSGLLEVQKSKKSPFLNLIKQYSAKIKYDPKTPNNNTINDLLIDQNLLFIGSNSLDITQISNSNKIIKLISKELNVGNPSVFSFTKYKQNFFVGTTNGLVFFENYFSPTGKKQVHKINLPKNRIRTKVIDSDSNLWISGTNSIYILPLHNFNKKNPQIITLDPFQNKDGNTIIRRLFKDNLGAIWIATNGDGLYRFTGNLIKKNISFKRYKSNSSKNSLPSDFIIGISQDQENNFWLSTQTGLCKLSFDKNTYNNPRYTNYFESEKGLQSNGQLSTFLDSENQLWIATRKGLHLYKNGAFISYGKKQGLSNTFVYNILEDNEKKLWLSTNGGIFRFDKTTKHFSNYTIKDGLQSTEFNLGAAFKDKQTGLLYFGGINGYNYFNPSRIDELDKEGYLKFTNLTVKNSVINSESSEVLDNNIVASNKIKLNYNDFPVNLSFSALDFRPNSNIEYAYKLLPDDTRWNELKDENSIQLLNLSPKKYTLQIQGMSRGKLWEKAPLEMVMNVKPPWYRSMLAYIFYLAIFLSIVYFYYKIMLQRRLAHQESLRLKDLDDLKSRFITNITHEFRTPLTIILGYLGNLKEQFQDKKDTLNSLETVEQNSNNLLSLVNQMLDLAKLEKGSLDLNLIQNDIISFLKHISNSFSSIAEDKKIQLIFESEVESLQMDFDSEKIRQVFTNLLSNALKFSSENTKINLLVEVPENSTEEILISISDQGYGIPQEDLLQIFDRFYQVNNDDFKVSQGTGIGLALTKELVELMSGAITVTSIIKKGTIFKVALPITRKAVLEDVEIPISKSTINKIDVPELENTIHLDDTNTVLIVEDNEDMARYIDSCLSSEFKTIKAVDGKHGFEMATAQIPDLILTDVMMPIMDGYELTKKLQESELTNHIPIIMLTSKAMQEDKMEGLKSGVDAYLTKPFSKKELLLRIKNLIAKRAKLQERYQVNTVTKKINKKEIITSDKNLEFLNKAISSIHKNIENSEFNTPELAKELAMSDSQLYRKLRAISNTSTAVFIRKVRLEKAKELLQTTNLTISEIAYTTGFNDPNWFSRIFKKEFTSSPTEIRK